LTTCFSELAALHPQPEFGGALREVVQMSFDLNRIAPQVVPDILFSVGKHAASSARELACVSDAFRLAGNEMLRLSRVHPCEADEARALQLYALAQLALPLRDDGNRHALFYHALPLQIALTAAEADIRGPLKLVAKSLLSQTTRRLDPLRISPNAPAHTAAQLAGLGAAAGEFVKIMHAEMGTPC
jgi:hypothetical protein